MIISNIQKIIQSKNQLTLLTIILICIFTQCAVTRSTGTFSEFDENRFDQSVSKYIGTPYVWGGTSTNGIDCSGLTLLVYKDQGFLLPRTSREQSTVGKAVGLKNVQTGDLLFFNTSGKGISHVGIQVDDHRMIHASSSQGVQYAFYNTDYWNRKFVGARRIVGSPYVSGELASERIIIISEYPMRVRDLVHIPTPYTLGRRQYNLDLRTNISGDLIVNCSIGFWNRIDIGTIVVLEQVLGDGEFNIKNPQFYSKLRILAETHLIPSLALGYSNSSHKQIDENNNDCWSNERGLYTVAAKKVLNSNNWLIGEGQLYIGFGIAKLSKYSKLKNDGYFFIGYQQQVLRKLLLMAELDNLTKNTAINAGMRFALTSDSSIEFSFSNLFDDKFKIDRALRFSYFLSY